MTNQLTKDEIKPGDHITIAGTVKHVDAFCTMSIVTKSGFVINANPQDIQTHRPMKEREQRNERSIVFVKN